MSKVFKKVVASMLTIAISLTTVDLISIKAYAKETSDAIKEEQKLKETDEEIDAYIDELVDDGKEWEENDKKATTNSITYELVDGIEKTVFYSDDVRYKNSKGDLVDYDSTLKGVSRKVTGGNNDLNDYVYENTLGNSKNYFPENVSIETPVLLEKEKYSVKVSPIENQSDDSELEDDENVETKAEVSNEVSVDKQKGIENKKNIKRERKNLKNLSEGKVIEDKVKDIYDKKQEKKVGIKYTSKEDKLAYEYISSEHGVKENIILDEVPESNVFSFSLELEGLIAKKDTCVEGISFFDENEDIVGGIQIPFMNDATGKAYSEDITYTLTDLGEGKYVVDMTVSEDYLKDKKREYPVTIDPTVTWTGTSYMYDTYVANNSYKTENFYSSSVTLLRAGVLPSGSAVTRSLLHWPKIASTVNDKYISSAKLSLYETGSGAASMKVRAYRVLSSWNKSTVTWNTQPTIDSSCYATLTTKGSAGSANTVSVKTFVQDIANESKSNYGLMLKNTNESAASKYVGYYNSRYTANAAYKPKMVIVYADRPSRPSSVTVANMHIKKGASLSVNWSGISSSSLSYVQYKVSEYNPDTKTWGDVIIPYSSSTKIGTSASGSKTITAVNALPEGYYKVVVRGVDSNGIVGVGASTSFVIDGTAPTLSSASISPAGTSSTKYGQIAPTVTWSASDKYYKGLQVSVNGSAYETLSTSTSSSASLEDYIEDAGTYAISLRAIDKAGNVSGLKTFTYYYDETIPEVGSAKCFYDVEDNTAKVRIDEASCGLAGFSGKVKYEINKANEAAITDVSKLTKTADISYKEKVGTFNLIETELPTSDGIYNIYMSITDKCGYTSEICMAQLIRFKDATYDGDEVLSAEYDKDNSVVTLNWNEDSKIQSVDLYSRYGEDGLYKFDQTVTDAYKVNIATSKIENQADYRLVVKYEDKQKLSSGITVVKSEEENEDGNVVESYDIEDVDSDNDGLLDIYEMWELGTDYNSEDSDNDGFSDGYEVLSLGTSPSEKTKDEDYDEDGIITSEEVKKGTHPYLVDSDFDGYNDKEDSNAIKTDVSNQSNAKYSTDVHIGLYDRKVINTDEDGNVSSYIINIYSGITVQETDILGNIVSYYYDEEENNIACIKYYNNEYLSNVYTYDNNDNMIYMAKNDFGYSFDYDNNGNLVNITISDRVLMSNTYRKVTDDQECIYINSSTKYGNGVKYEYSYDSSNENITSIKIDDVVVYEMTYDADGNMIEQKDNKNSITYTYEYNKEGKMVAINRTDGFAIKYNSEKEITETDTTETGEVIYIHNGEEKKCTYTLFTNEEEIEVTSSLASGDKHKTILVGEYEKEFSISNDNNTILSTKVSKSDDGTISIINNNIALEYVLDKNNNITSVLKDGKTISTYMYDGLEQLIRENDVLSNKTITYQYDKNGNILNRKIFDYTSEDIVSEPIKTYEYVYNNSSWKDLLTQYNGQTITYDEIGNPLIYRDGISFTWEDGRNLAMVINKDKEKTCYSYNKDGIRIAKNINGVETKYYVKDYNILKEETNGKIIWYLYDGNGNLVGFENNDNVYYYERNIQNDIIGIIDITGDKKVTYSYDAYGNTVKIDGDKDLAELNPFRYRGYYYDKETGFYYLNSRYYDSKTGRFINADDANIAIISSITNNNGNLYSYCNNNPVKNTDVTGYWVSVDSLILDSITSLTRTITRSVKGLNSIRINKAVSNYFYNKKHGKKYIKSGKYIYGQESNKKVAKLKFGFARFKNVGCEIIAIYNALCMKKKKPNIAKIALELEINGGQMGGGFLGCNPKYIASYLEVHGRKYTKYTSMKKIEASREKGNVYILSMWCEKYDSKIKTYLSGVHTIAIKCTSKNKLKIYNMYNTDIATLSATSFENMFSKYDGRLICAYKLK